MISSTDADKVLFGRKFAQSAAFFNLQNVSFWNFMLSKFSLTKISLCLHNLEFIASPTHITHTETCAGAI